MEESKQWGIPRLKHTWPVVRKAEEHARESHKIRQQKETIPEGIQSWRRSVPLHQVPAIQATLEEIGTKICWSFPHHQGHQSSDSWIKVGPKSQAHPSSFPLQPSKAHSCGSLVPRNEAAIGPNPNWRGTKLRGEGILDSRIHQGWLQYLILWKDFPPCEIEWVNAQRVIPHAYFANSTTNTLIKFIESLILFFLFSSLRISPFSRVCVCECQNCHLSL